jgi:predicted dehydrogenase
MAGQAVLKSLAIASQTDPELDLLPVRIATREAPLISYISDNAHNVLFITNPSGLHASKIVEGDRAGFCVIAADKPVCVRLEEVALLRDIQTPVTVFHGYRVLWGTRTIKAMIEADELGELLAFESRYWQSSAAVSALGGATEKRPWKNNRELNGPSDTLADLGSHVADICIYLMGEIPLDGFCRLFYWNSTAPHRDTHVHLSLRFGINKYAFASISKTVHGATNNFEYTVIGSRGTATWRFLQPDEVEFATGNHTSILRRDRANPSSGTAPFHGLGWLEGYVEITHQTLRRAVGLSSVPIPVLKEAVAAMEVLFNAEAAARGISAL